MHNNYCAKYDKNKCYRKNNCLGGVSNLDLWKMLLTVGVCSSTCNNNHSNHRKMLLYSDELDVQNIMTLKNIMTHLGSINDYINDDYRDNIMYDKEKKVLTLKNLEIYDTELCYDYESIEFDGKNMTIVLDNVIFLATNACVHSLFTKEGNSITLVLRNISDIIRNRFSDCSALQNVIIEGSINSIGHSAFRACGTLQNVIIEGSINSIGYGAFSACGTLQNVIIEGSINSIGSGAFSSTKFEYFVVDEKSNIVTDHDWTCQSNLKCIAIPKNGVCDEDIFDFTPLRYIITTYKVILQMVYHNALNLCSSYDDDNTYETMLRNINSDTYHLFVVDTYTITNIDKIPEIQSFTPKLIAFPKTIKPYVSNQDYLQQLSSSKIYLFELGIDLNGANSKLKIISHTLQEDLIN